jgi:drug/metabolite transporter (DMT)-like permease
VSALALSLVLGSAVLHATWNLLAKGAGGGAAFVWLGGLAAALLYAPVALGWAALSGGEVGAAGVAFMAGSAVIHSGYFLALQRGYAAGDLSLVYPLARGTGPLLSVVAAVAILGERPGLAALAGAALVVVGALSLTSGVGRGAAAGAATAYALVTATLIATYTLWDAHAVTTLGQSPLLYYWGSEVARAVFLAPLALRDRGAVRSTWRGERRAVLGVAVLSPLAYVLVLMALTLAPVSLVAPAREASIVIGALLGASVLGEGHGRRRAAAAVVILAGIALLALG